MSEDEAKLLNTVRRHEFQDALAYGKTRQGAFENAMLHFGHPLFAGGQDLTASDEGRGAAEIRNLDDGKTPSWLLLWRRERAKLNPRQRKILDALALDWKSSVAAEITGCDRKTVHRAKTFFKMHFAQCLRAWKRDFGL